MYADSPISRIEYKVAARSNFKGIKFQLRGACNSKTQGGKI